MRSISKDEDGLKYEEPEQWIQELDNHINNTKLVQIMRGKPDFKESRPHMNIPSKVRQCSLTAGALTGPDMIPVAPYYFNHKNGDSAVSIFYVGTHVSGHPGIVHGGFLATMLDEGLGLCAIPVLPDNNGVTAQLNIAYKKPTMAGQFLVIVANTVKVEGRKVWTKGCLCSLEELEVSEDGQIQPMQPLVEASALFIAPKQTQMLKSLYQQAT